MSTRLGYIEKIQFIGEKTEKTVETKCDTGAARTSICESLAEEIGVGDPVDSVTVHSSNGSQERDVYEISVIVGSTKHSVAVSVTNREGMNYDAILGRDILSEYLVDSSVSFVLEQ